MAGESGPIATDHLVGARLQISPSLGDDDWSRTIFLCHGMPRMVCAKISPIAEPFAYATSLPSVQPIRQGGPYPKSKTSFMERFRKLAENADKVLAELGFEIP